MELLSLIAPFLIGSAIIVILCPLNTARGPGLILNVCLGAGIGLGITSAAIFLWLALIGPPKMLYFYAELALALLLAFLAYNRVHSATARIPFKSASSIAGNSSTLVWLRNLFLILLLISVASYLLKAFFDVPHGIWDAWDTWNYRARWLFRGGEKWFYAFTLRARDGLDYPILTTASIFRIWNLIEQEHIVVPILVSGFFTFGTIVVLYSSLTMLRNSNQGYLAAIFMFITTQLINVATYQYSDIPLAFFILSTLALFALRDHAPQAALRISLLAGLTASCAAWTKNEGIVFWVLVVLVRFAGPVIFHDRLNSLKEFISFILGAAPILSTLIYFKLNFTLENVHINADNLQKLGVYIFDTERLLQVLVALGGKFLTFNDGVVVLLVVYGLLSGVDRAGPASRRIWPHAILMFLMFCSYFFAYFISDNPSAFLSASLRRIVIQLWPSLVFILFYLVKGPEKDAVLDETGQNFRQAF